MTLTIGQPFSLFQYTFAEEIPIDRLVDFADKRRLAVFHAKGTTCSNPACGRIGTRLIKGLARDGAVKWCVYTDDLIPLTIDHIIPVSKGGEWKLDNLQPLCYPCNQLKGDRMPNV